MLFTSTIRIFFCLAFFAVVNAATNWGRLNPARDCLVRYDTVKYPTMVEFSQEWRKKCIRQNSFVLRHHDMDAVPTQTGGEAWVFCGGVKKNLITGVAIKGSAVKDYTKQTLFFFGRSASIKTKPLGLEGCKAYKALHPEQPTMVCRV